MRTSVEILLILILCNISSRDYIRGSIVRLRVKELELSTRFLGSDKDLTILEADCHLLGLVSTPGKSRFREKQIH